MSAYAWLIVLFLAAATLAGIVVFLTQYRSHHAAALAGLVVAMFAALSLGALTFLAGSLVVSVPLANKNALGGFPFPVGTTWVYSQVEYQQVIGDPTLIITATNLITETVVRTQGSGVSQVFLHKQVASLVSAPPGWEDNSSNFNWERWYRIDGNQIFSSPEGFPNIDLLIYDFPLAVGKSWCPEQPPPAYNPDCMSMGRRTVHNRTGYTTPVGTFDECYEISDKYNSGGVSEWFCYGIGTVARKYDHAGSRFGFEDTLVGYFRGPGR